MVAAASWHNLLLSTRVTVFASWMVSFFLYQLKQRTEVKRKNGKTAQTHAYGDWRPLRMHVSI